MPIILLLSLQAGPIASQSLLRKALFLGNSYTYVNNLPGLTAALANSAGDSLYFESNAPGGYTLGWEPIAHTTTPASLSLISGNTWDYVILQEQSQTPAIPALRDSCMYPASLVLFDSIKSANPCAQVLFYLTWGRRFGGMQCFNSYYCSTTFTDFDQMQDSLTVAYKGIADSLGSHISPVGEAWRLALNTTTMVLHSSDNSHPSLNGSYLAACVFYSSIFGKPSTGLPFTAGLLPDSALILQQAADSIVFGYSNYWNLNLNYPIANFTYTLAEDTLFTQNFSTGSEEWRWNFGDGVTSNAFEPVHVYEDPGTYQVSLVASNPCFSDTMVETVVILPTSTGQVANFTLPIQLIGPDAYGNIKFEGYKGNGNLMIYDMTGRMISNRPVISGTTHLNNLEKQLYMFLLVNKKAEPLAKGKLLISH